MGLNWEKPDYGNGVSSIIYKSEFVYKKQPVGMQKRELEFLNILYPYGYIPDYKIISEEIIEFNRIYVDKVTNEDEFLSHYDKFLSILKKKNIRHGDLTSANILPYKNKPYILDWNESRYYSENLSDKRPEKDAFWFWRSMVYYIDISIYPLPGNGRGPEMWYILRDHVLNPEYKTVIDLGCGRGDFSIRSLMNGKQVNMVDFDEGQLNIGKEKIEKRGLTNVTYYIENILDFIKRDIQSDILFCFSVLPYLSRSDMLEVIRYAKKFSRFSFFEIQYTGDGPGCIKGDSEIIDIFKQCGFIHVEKIGFTTVEYRKKDRIIWRCT